MCDKDILEQGDAMDSNTAKGRSANDSPQVNADKPFTFEEETRWANDRVQSAVQTVRAQNVPQGTEPAFLFHLRF